MIGIFIGSFNPPTIAHIEICKRLANEFQKIVLVPVNSNKKELIDINKRIEMLNILKNKYPFLEVSKIMKKYANFNYRIVDLLNDTYGDIALIIGSDLLDKLSLFDNYEYLLQKYHFLVITRDNIDINKIINNQFKKYQQKFKIINYNSNISSTLVKDNLKNKKEIKGLLDEDVYKFINEKHLY